VKCNHFVNNFHAIFSGYELGASGRLALMAKLAEGTGMKLPEIAAQALANNAMLTGAGAYQSVAAVSAAAQQQQQQVFCTN
jgi:hypothetical protein